MGSLVRAILAWPAFLYGVFVMFWCFELGAITGFIKWWDFGRRRNDIHGVVLFLKAAFGYKVVKVGEQKLYREGRCVYLANHRCWADFFCEMFIVGARAVPLSRRAVGFAFPAFSSSLIAVHSILLFNRSGVKDTKKFNEWVDRELEKGPQHSLLVYPEGTRSLKTASLPLKRGMLRYAHTRRLPVQVLITTHKEELLNERARWAHLGTTLVTGFSEVLETSKYEDFEEFMAAVQALWDRQWEVVHAAPREGPELQPIFDSHSYSTATKVKQTAALGFWTAVLLATVLYTLRTLLAVATAGTAGLLAVLGLLLYVAASLVAAATLPAPVRKAAPPKKQD